MNKKKRELACQIARRTEELLSKGWTQGKFTDYEGNYCLVGAANKAMIEVRFAPGASTLAYAAHSDVLRAVQKKLPDSYGSIMAFNDTPGRTQAEVVAVVKAAADELCAEADVE